jgi:hypothetical protein
MLKKISFLAFALIMLSSLNIMAGNDNTKDKMNMKTNAVKSNAMKSEMVTVEGTLVCPSCELKKTEGADAACKIYGHRFALKTKDGRYINFLENKYSEDLIKGDKYHGQDIKVHGNYYANANLLEVKSFEVNGKNLTWCDHHEAMDACMANK